MEKMKFIVHALATIAIASSTASMATEPGTISGLQVAVGDCVVAKPAKKATEANEKSALDAIAGAVISQGVNYIGKALTAAGAAKTWTVTGSRNIQAKSDAFPECVLVVRGTFATAGDPNATWTLPEPWPATLRKKLGANGIWLTGVPDFLFEGQIVAASDQSALTIRPVMVTYSRPIGTRFLRPSTDRHVALFFAITAPGMKPTLETSPAATIVLGNFSAGSTAKFDGEMRYSSPYESPWFSLTKADSIKPLTVTAMLSETQDEQSFLLFLGTVLSDPKVVASANTQLTQLVIPSVAAQAASDANAKAASLASDADAKLALSVAKLNACKVADAATTVTAGAEARTALRNYMIADAALPAPHRDVQNPTIDMIDLRKSAEEIKTGCSQALASITKP